jgi:hypothetical protein
MQRSQLNSGWKHHGADPDQQHACDELSSGVEKRTADQLSECGSAADSQQRERAREQRRGQYGDTRDPSAYAGTDVVERERDADDERFADGDRTTRIE